MPEIPFIDLTPNAPDRDFSESITREAYDRIERLDPDVYRLLANQRAFTINIYGDDLQNVPAWLAKYREGGHRDRLALLWEHSDAGTVVTFVLEIGDGRTVLEVLTDKLKLDFGNV